MVYDPAKVAAMSNLYLRNLMHKLFGDHRDQRVAVQEAGFENEAGAAAWAGEVLRDEAFEPSSKLAIIAALRRARPDLTLRTATYIAHQYEARSAA